MKLTTEQEEYYHLKYGLGLRTMTLIANISMSLIEFEQNLKTSLDLAKNMNKVKA